MVNADNNDFTLYKSFPNGGSVHLMTGLDKSSPDYDDLLSIACLFAKEGKEAKVLSPIHYRDPKYHEVFGSLIGTRYYRKCPDLLIDGIFYEYESCEPPFETGKLERMIARGSKQASDIVVDIRGISITNKSINGKIQRLREQNTFEGTINSVWVYDGVKVGLVYKTSRGASPSTSAEKSLRLANP